MCGIVGVVQRIEPVDRAVLSGMTEALHARGPDDAGYFVDNRVGLGHRRLRILDLSTAGRQPMFNEDKSVAVVFNGEIYNAPALRRDLEPRHTFSSRTDTEVLLHLYEERGAELTRSLEGMFAFSLYDRERQKITCARDRFGEKPFFYVLTDHLFAFASEPKSLYQHPEIRRQLRLNTDAVRKYLCYGYIPSPHTLFLPLKKLKSAHLLQFDIRRWTIVREEAYWDLPSDHTEDTTSTITETITHIDTLIQQAVSARLNADVPVGIFLSGGVDSSVIAAHVARAGRTLTAFTIASDDPRIDESPYAMEVARHLHIPCRVFPLTGNRVRESCEAMLNYLDEPLADAAIFPTAFLAQEAHKDVTVVLSGDGGDELFGGYLKYRAQQLAERLGILSRIPLPNTLVRMLEQRVPTVGKLISHLSLPFAARQFLWGSGSPPLPDICALLREDALDHASVFAEAQEALVHCGFKDPVSIALYLDGKILLPDGYNVKTDQATMAASLELRSPFLDTLLAETVTKLPSTMKVRGRKGKILLKAIAERLVPATVTKRKKLGFGVPLGRWMRHETKDLFHDMSSVPELADVLDMAHVARLWKEHNTGIRDHQFTLLRISMLGAALHRRNVKTT